MDSLPVRTLTAFNATPIPAPPIAASWAAAPHASSDRAYPAPAPTPTQSGPEGIRFDFNEGCRVLLPTNDPEDDARWRVTLRDRATGNVLFDTVCAGGLVVSAKRYYVPFRIEIARRGRPVFGHDHDCRGQEVHIAFPVGTLGDVIGWLTYAARFQDLHHCRLTCSMAPALIALFAEAYPDIRFVAPEAVEPATFYASYYLGLFFDDAENCWQPCDFRLVGLHRTAGYILGVDPAEAPPRLVLPDAPRAIAEPYVCIGVQSTTQAKYWNNPEGWPAVIRFLKARGYRVLCIDQKPANGSGLVWTHIPHGAEDMTGNLPLAARAHLLRHAAAFIGLSSGLAWLAWAAGTRVVMISGFSHPGTEFATPQRVINYHACNSCWNDPRHRFDHKDFLWCPRHAGTPRQFECTRLITPEQVIGAIRTIPGFDAAGSSPATSTPATSTKEPTP